MHNMIYLIGRLVDNPVIEENLEDKKISNIEIAVQRAWKNEEGVYETDFFELHNLNNSISDHGLVSLLVQPTTVTQGYGPIFHVRITVYMSFKKNSNN